MKEFMMLLISTEKGWIILAAFVVAICCFLLAYVVKGKQNTIEDKNENFEYAVKMCVVGGVILISRVFIGLWDYAVVNGFVTTTRNTDDLMRAVTAILIGAATIAAEVLYEKLTCIQKSENDIYVDGIVTGTHNDARKPYSGIDNSHSIVPGYKKLVIEYTDPYDGQKRVYKFKKEVRVKKHPIGSAYRLRYSREKRFAYDEKNERMNPYLKLAFLFMGGMMLFAGVSFLLRGLNVLFT